MIYLDNNASTKLCVQALDAMMPWLTTHWGNPSSTYHSEGRVAQQALDEARMEIAAAFQAKAGEIVFTSGATESNTIAILGARIRNDPPRKIFTMATEHLSVLTACQQVGQLGASVHFVKPRDRESLVDALVNAGIGEGDLVSVDWVNNETGIITDVASIARLAKNTGALLHVDAAQAPGKVLVDLLTVEADYVTLSAHKMHGPRGVGALVIKTGTNVASLWAAGGQERGIRGGTENVPGIVGFAAASKAVADAGEAAIRHMNELQLKFETALKAAKQSCCIVGEDAPRAPNTSLVSWPGLSSQAILHRLDQIGICASAGSACSSRFGASSHVLQAMGMPQEVVRGAIRFSTSRYTTEREIELAATSITAVVRELRSDLHP